MPHLSKYEKETIIHWNEETSKVTVYTCSKPVMRRCERLGFKEVNEEHFCAEDGGGLVSRTFQCTRRDVLIRKFKPKILTAKQRAEIRERFAK